MQQGAGRNPHQVGNAAGLHGQGAEQLASSIIDPNSFTVLAHSKKTKELLAKASCKATPAGEIVSFKAIPVKS